MHLINVFGDDASPDFACSERKRTRKDTLDEIEIILAICLQDSIDSLSGNASLASFIVFFFSLRYTTKERSHNTKMKIISTKRLN